MEKSVYCCGLLPTTIIELTSWFTVVSENEIDCFIPNILLRHLCHQTID